ncbi:aldo/keto reductase [Campylobacter sp. MIT 99-7217]|uniref:aldo/keto reductase n=1 Tax=Campylobacter sp. MIT 99-7217 TaxID=535091 RepID=UPI00115B828D|nr:aldo/keto reductase [Campylobacter sp. MIT 99-7217]TQR30939.1 aldo/keto reductase [Campylobacter sp. MIT 99-7217]
MQYRKLGNSGFIIPAISFGTVTFGGGNDIVKAWGDSSLKEARELIDICLDYGANSFDTADGYSAGKSEEMLGELSQGRRHKLFLATKTGMPMGQGVNDSGTSYAKIISSCEASLKRLRTDYIDLYYLHCFDALTPIEESLRAIDVLIRSGKIRYFGVSNYSGWHLMKMLALCERHFLPKPAVHQLYYSLAAREAENELLPLALDQNVGTMVWSPLSGSFLTGKISRSKNPPSTSRLSTKAAWQVDKNKLFEIIDELENIAKECNHSVAQVALAWLLARPSISSLIVGARNKDQLIENLRASELVLSKEQINRLTKISSTRPAYPYWHQQETTGHRDPRVFDYGTCVL